MASNVFGNPITNQTLEAMPKYEGKTITCLDRAAEAINMKNDGGKDKDVRAYVDSLKQEWGTGVSTLCVFYNATGDPITFICDHNWYGHIGPAPYPLKIANGQWGGFLHVKTSGAATGSSAAVVYRGKNNNDIVCDWMAAWSNPWNHASWSNTAFTEIREEGHYDTQDNWDYISNLVYDSGLSKIYEWNGCKSSVITGNSTSPEFEAIFTLSGVAF